MKTLFTTSIIFFAFTSASIAQETRYRDPDADKFVGIWKYESEDYSIALTLRKEVFVGIDHIFGTYRIQKDGIIYEGPREKFLQGGTLQNRNPNELSLRLFDDIFFYQALSFSLTMPNRRSNHVVLKTHEIRDRALPEGKSRPEWSLLPPDGTVLTKQK
jgi:hypothetical protein